MNRQSHRTARRALVGLVAAAALAAPAQAAADGAWVAFGAVHVYSGTAAADIAVTREADAYVVADRGQDLSAGWGCTSTGTPTKVVCPVPESATIVALLGDGDDRFDASSVSTATKVDGGNGNDRIATGTGLDHVYGADGNDVFLTRDGVVDQITCGGGTDSGEVDTDDSLTADCEPTVARPAAADAPPTDAPAPASGETGVATEDDAVKTPPAVAPIAITSPARMTLSAKGAVTIGVTCTAESGRCKGTIELFEANGRIKARSVVGTARRRKASRKKATLLGRGRFSVRAGGKKKVQLRLDRRGRQRVIRKKKRKKTRARLVITMTAPDGTKTTMAKNVTISPPKHRRAAR